MIKIIMIIITTIIMIMGVMSRPVRGAPVFTEQLLICVR